MAGGNKNIKPEDGKQFSKEYQPDEKWTEKKALELGEELIEWLKEGGENNIMFEEFLVMKKDLYPQLIGYLTNKFSSFLKLIDKSKKIQEIKLVKYGLTNDNNSQITKFVLTNHHDYGEKTQTEHSGSLEVKPITGMQIK